MTIDWSRFRWFLLFLALVAFLDGAPLLILWAVLRAKG